MPETQRVDILNCVTDLNLRGIFEFILEIGKLKSVLRQTYMPDQDRYENSAEHSWHLTMMAILLKEYASTEINIEKTIKLLTVHDLAETWVGDTFFYNQNEDRHAQELRALESKIKSLPSHIQKELIDLWKEFEEGKTPEAKYGKALDRFNPFLYQLQNGGESWRRNKISYEKAIDRNKHIEDGAPVLWSAYKNLAEQATSLNLFYKEEKKNA